MQVKISLPDELVEEMEKARGDVSRSVFIQRSIEHRLGRTVDVINRDWSPRDSPRTEPLAETAAKSTASAPRKGTAALRGTPSARAKRNVKPRPKGSR